MSEKEVWWIVVVNYGGITGPICCYRKDEYEDNVLWDRTGNFDCSMKAGIWPIGIMGEDSECSQYQTTSKREAEIFAEGARATAKLIKGILA